MAEFTKYEPGTPTWVDLGARDVAAASRFYTSLFGWTAQDMGEEAGHYTMMTLRGKNVCAVGPMMDGGEDPGSWNTYLASADVDETARKVKEAGGTVVMEPMDVMDAGRMAIFQDPTGARVSAWQARRHTGAELANEPNTVTWNELQTRDTDGARRFYDRAFGLTGTVHEDMGGYIVLHVGEKGVAGMMKMPESIPAEVPPNWLVYFEVEDADAAAARAGELGGRTLMAPMDIPGVGRFAVLADSQGSAFGVIKSRPADQG